MRSGASLLQPSTSSLLLPFVVTLVFCAYAIHRAWDLPWLEVNEAASTLYALGAGVVWNLQRRFFGGRKLFEVRWVYESAFLIALVSAGSLAWWLPLVWMLFLPLLAFFADWACGELWDNGLGPLLGFCWALCHGVGWLAVRIWTHRHRER